MNDAYREISADELRALRECRFVTVNRERSRVWVYDYDPKAVAAIGEGAFTFERAPGVWDCQMTTTHPRIIEEVEKILGLERGELA